MALWKAGSVLMRVRERDDDAGLLGASLVAAFVGSLFFIATAGFGPTTYVLAGLLLSYSRCVERAQPVSAAPAPLAAQRMQRRGVA